MFNSDNSPEKKKEYKTKLQGMSDSDLFSETKNKIWLSAFASNNRHSCYHWQCDYTYGEWKRRGKVEQYSAAYEQVSKF